MKKNYQSGFTLIELLVVIAIIGILASVVLASLNSARNKGADAAVKANMANIRAQAELYYDNPSAGNGKYNTGTATTTCSAGMFSDTVIQSAYTQIVAQSTGPVACYTDATGQKWAMSTTLKGGTTWCVDNNGFAKPGAAGTNGQCS